MTVTNISSRTVKTYTVKIDGGDVRPVPHSRAARAYRVTTLTVEKRDGNVSRVTLQGPVLKKDGADSANWAEEKFYGPRPAWVESIIRGLA